MRFVVDAILGSVLTLAVMIPVLMRYPEQVGRIIDKPFEFLFGWYIRLWERK